MGKWELKVFKPQKGDIRIRGWRTVGGNGNGNKGGNTGKDKGDTSKHGRCPEYSRT